MSNEIANRIKRFIEYKRLTTNSFATILGYASSEKIARLFRKNDANPSYDIIYDITNKFVEINIEWLITGEGEMLKENTKEQAEIQPATVSVPAGDGLVEYLKEQLKEKNEETKALNNEIKELREEMGKLRNELEFLKSSNNTTTSQNNAVKLGIGTVS
jgi:transcriptional regulator with XRE-family HTH domain